MRGEDISDTGSWDRINNGYEKNRGWGILGPFRKFRKQRRIRHSPKRIMFRLMYSESGMQYP